MVDLYSAAGSTSDQVTTADNTPGVFTPVFQITPTSGTALIFRNVGPVGGARNGIPIFAKFEDDGGSALPINTEVVLGYKDETMDHYAHISEVRRNINDYINYTVSEQQDKDNVDNFKFPLHSKSYTVTDEQELALLLNSSTAVDHDAGETEIYFHSEYVAERPMDR